MKYGNIPCLSNAIATIKFSIQWRTLMSQMSFKNAMLLKSTSTQKKCLPTRT